MIISKGQAGYIAETASPRYSLTVSRPSPYFMGGEMNIVPSQDLFLVFDDKAVRAMGAAFDQACRSLRHFAHFDRVHDLVAKRIIEAAKNGERDPIRLHWQAVMGFSIDDVSMPVDSVGRDFPVPPVYTSIARLA
jgi:hypothetical protein